MFSTSDKITDSRGTLYHIHLQYVITGTPTLEKPLPPLPPAMCAKAIEKYVNNGIQPTDIPIRKSDNSCLLLY